jgi:hypothetical protein
MTAPELAYNVGGPGALALIGAAAGSVVAPETAIQLVQKYGWFAPAVVGVVWGFWQAFDRVSKAVEAYIQSAAKSQETMQTNLAKLTESSVAKTELIRAITDNQRAIVEKQSGHSTILAQILERLQKD